MVRKLKSVFQNYPPEFVVVCVTFLLVMFGACFEDGMDHLSGKISWLLLGYAYIGTCLFGLFKRRADILKACFIFYICVLVVPAFVRSLWDVMRGAADLSWALGVRGFLEFLLLTLIFMRAWLSAVEIDGKGERS
ncbi:MAG: hypothetical protein IJR14_00345 [Synergistaceae bacterium]|nr:hypothetical protein [Synergistaceae bacterium]